MSNNQETSSTSPGETGPAGIATVTIDGGTFKKAYGGLLKRVEFLTDEIDLEFKNGDMIINAMDNSHVAMIHAVFSPGFDHTGLDFIQRIKVSDHLKLLGSLKASTGMIDAIFTAEATSFKGFTLNARRDERDGLQGNERDIVNNFASVLEDKWTVRAYLTREMLNDALKDAGLIDDIAVFTAENGVMNLEASTENAKFKRALEVDFRTGEVATARGCMSVHFMVNTAGTNAFTGTSKAVLAEKLEIRMATDMPMQVNETTDLLRVVYLQAPRVEEEEDDEFGDDFDDVRADPLDDEDEDAPAPRDATLDALAGKYQGTTGCFTVESEGDRVKLTGILDEGEMVTSYYYNGEALYGFLNDQGATRVDSFTH